MEYIISEEELIKLTSIIGWGNKTADEYLNELLKSKQSIELVIKGKIKQHWKNGQYHLWNKNDLVCSFYGKELENLLGNNIKIYIQKVKEI